MIVEETNNAPLEGDLLEGTPYRAIARLGAGGMGEVFAAEHRRLGTLVVVKLIHARLAENAQLVDRLRLEAQTLAKLAPHPNLVAVTDLGETPDKRPYYVMEKLAGKTLLAELRDQGTIPILPALDYMRQALAGLQVAHQAGLVHRDVKLDNLFLCGVEGGPRTVKLLDFGIAKVVDAAAKDAPKPLMIPTEEGMSVGTPRFFSPEQAIGKAVDARSDVYATGIVLYTMLAGRGPFDHTKDMLSLARAHVGEVAVPPSMLSSQPIPEALDQAVLKAMAKRPEDRFQSAQAFANELARIAEKLPELWDARPSAPPMGAIKKTMLLPTVPRDARPPERDAGVTRADAAPPAPGPLEEDTTTVPGQPPARASSQPMNVSTARMMHPASAPHPSPSPQQPQGQAPYSVQSPPLRAMNIQQNIQQQPIQQVAGYPQRAQSQLATGTANRIAAPVAKRSSRSVAPIIVVLSAIAFAILATFALLRWTG